MRGGVCVKPWVIWMAQETGLRVVSCMSFIWIEIMAKLLSRIKDSTPTHYLTARFPEGGSAEE